MAGLRGWRQLQVCLIVLLWAAVCSSALEYAMACIVHDTMDMHLEAGHTPVRPTPPGAQDCHRCTSYEALRHSGLRSRL